MWVTCTHARTVIRTLSLCPAWPSCLALSCAYVLSRAPVCMFVYALSFSPVVMFVHALPFFFLFSRSLTLSLTHTHTLSLSLALCRFGPHYRGSQQHREFPDSHQHRQILGSGGDCQYHSRAEWDGHTHITYIYQHIQ